MFKLLKIRDKGLKMSNFKFVSHESYPDDEYTKESVVICIDEKHRVTFVRKKMQNGSMFWDVISAAVRMHGEKKYLRSFMTDSNFLNEDIKKFLDSRSWEKIQPVRLEDLHPEPKSLDDAEVPF